MLIKEMDFGNLELLFLIALIVVAVFFFTRCGIKCKCKNSNGGNGGADTYRRSDLFDDEMDDDSAYDPTPFSGGSVLPGAWSLPFSGGKVIGEGTYADKDDIGTF